MRKSHTVILMVIIFLLGMAEGWLLTYKPEHVPATLAPMHEDETTTGQIFTEESLKGGTAKIEGWYRKDGTKITALDEKLKSIMLKGDLLIKRIYDTTYVDDCEYRNAVYAQYGIGSYEAYKYIKDNPAKDTLWDADLAMIQRVEIEIGTRDGHVIEKSDTIEFTYWFLKDSTGTYFHEVEEHFGEKSHYMNHK